MHSVICNALLQNCRLLHDGALNHPSCCMCPGMGHTAFSYLVYRGGVFIKTFFCSISIILLPGFEVPSGVSLCDGVFRLCLALPGVLWLTRNAFFCAHGSTLPSLLSTFISIFLMYLIGRDNARTERIAHAPNKTSKHETPLKYRFNTQDTYPQRGT